MTVWDLLRTAGRRWPLVLACALLTVAAAYVVDLDRSLWYTRSEVTFLAPSSRLYPNSLSTTSEGLIIAAGAIGKEVSGPGKVVKLASPEATLVGLGIREGWSIRLPDTGGQWAGNFTQQQLVIEVIGSDPRLVESRELELIAELRRQLDLWQRDHGVDPVNDITAKVTPEWATLQRVDGNRVRAVGMTGIVGVAATLLVLTAVEKRARRRRAEHERRWVAHLHANSERHSHGVL
jgi:hypothetical protein